MSSVRAGTLYLVSTPIGNLGDMTHRAVEVLSSAALVIAEDTRHSRRLLDHYKISTPLKSYHEHNEAQETPRLVARLRAGDSVALISDAGTPLISDPGSRLVVAALEANLPVVPIPGASAFLCGLAASGLPTDSFRFNGFLPAKSGQRRQALEGIQVSSRTQVFYEAPHRLKQAVGDIVEVLGTERPIVIAREITKIHEEFLRGSAGEIEQTLNARGDIKGEITLLVGKAEETKQEMSRATIGERLRQVLSEEKLDEKAALKRVAKELGISKSQAYRELQRLKLSRN